MRQGHKVIGGCVAVLDRQSGKSSLRMEQMNKDPNKVR